MAKRTRRISTEQDFMCYKTDDLLFTYMSCAATYDGERLYLPRVKFKDRDTQFQLENWLDISHRTLDRHVADLEAKGLISKDEVNYYFPYEENKRYQIIEVDMLRYLLNTSNKHVI